MSEILSEERVETYLQGPAEVVDLAKSHEVLRAQVADYEQRGMGKLDGYEVPPGKGNVYAMHCSYCHGTSNEEDRCQACHETHVEYYIYLEPVAEKGGGG